MPARALILKSSLFIIILALLFAPLSLAYAQGGTPALPTPASPGADGGQFFAFPARPDVPAKLPNSNDPHLVASGFGQPPSAAPNTPAGDDRENSDRTIWAVYEHQTSTDVLNTAINNNYRVVDLYVESTTSPYQLTAVYVANTGSYAKSWWFVVDMTPADLLTVAISNNARIVVLKAFDDPAPGGSVRHYAVLISNTGADAKTWFFYNNKTVADITALWQANSARLVQVNSYVKGGVTLYDVVMISNTGTDARSWWWYVNATPADIATNINANNARLTDLDIDPASGNYNAIMTSCASGCPAWWWYVGLSTANLLNTVLANGARIIDANSTPGCGDRCWTIVLIDNAHAAIAGNAGVASATIQYAGTSTLSDGNSIYSISVPTGWSGTVTPFKLGYTFWPASRSYTSVGLNQFDQNFAATRRQLRSDFNGDGKSDLAVFRKSSGYWYVRNPDGTSSSKQWGNAAAGDIPLPGDYNGDGQTDFAVWRKSTGFWYVIYADNSTYSQQWGNAAAGDIPEPGDYNGDGKTDLAVWRPTNGTWYIHYADGTTSSQQWGNAAAGDIPVPGDYNGDGKTDYAVWRPSNGTWYIRYADGTTASRQWGNAAAGDIPVPGDYDGDGKTELAVWRQSTGFWYIKYANDTTSSQQWGNAAAGDMPVSGDFNGDGTTDYAVWRPTNGTWYIRFTDGTTYTQQWGNAAAGDIPMPPR